MESKEYINKVVKTWETCDHEWGNELNECKGCQKCLCINLNGILIPCEGVK